MFASRTTQSSAAAANAPRDAITVDIAALEREYKLIRRRGAKLQAAEFKAFLAKIGFKKAPDVAQQLFNAFDVNRDGELGVEEFITGLTCLTSEDVDQKLDFVFRMLDKDGSGGISEMEIQLFMKAFFHMGLSTVEIILRTVEGLVGTTKRAQAGSYRLTLIQQAEEAMRTTNQQQADKAIIIADRNADGMIDYPEFFSWVKQEPQMVRWVENIGHYWASLAMSAGDPNLDPRLVTGRGDAERQINSAKVAAFLQSKMVRGPRLQFGAPAAVATC